MDDLIKKQKRRRRLGYGNDMKYMNRDFIMVNEVWIDNFITKKLVDVTYSVYYQYVYCLCL